jgi:UDP-N-acetylglucosamine:LPS N-acetylglucosamine transferase
MKPPSVLGIISYKVFPAQMGGQKCVAAFYSQLAKQTKLVLAVAKENTAIKDTGMDILPFLYHHKYGFANLRYLFRLRKLIKQQNIDVICIEHSYLGWLGILLRWLTKKPFIIRSHNIEAHRFRDMHKPWWRIYHVYERWAHRKANHSFFITKEDKQWAIDHWQLDIKNCTVITYGTGITEPVTINAKAAARQQLITENKLDPRTRLFLFNGTLDYVPNTDALRIIISELLPLLQPFESFFKIFICGNRLSHQWEEVLQAYPAIIYKGFVDDINLYLDGVDCFINPVTLGSGIKIKLVDALSHNQSCISTKSGAKGIPQEITGQKLVLVDDYDWPGFTRAMVEQNENMAQDIPPAFYQFFNWDTIVQKALLSLPTL